MLFFDALARLRNEETGLGFLCVRIEILVDRIQRMLSRIFKPREKYIFKTSSQSGRIDIERPRIIEAIYGKT